MLVLSMLGGASYGAGDSWSEMRFTAPDGRHVMIRASEPRVISAGGDVEVQAFVGLHGIDTDGTYHHFFKGSIVASSADEAMGYLSYPVLVAAGVMPLDVANGRTGYAITLEAGKLATASPPLVEQEKLGSMVVSFVGMSGTAQAREIAKAALAFTEAPVCGPTQTCEQDLTVEIVPATAAGALGAWVRTSGGAAIPEAQVALTGLISQCPFYPACTAECLLDAPTISTEWGVTASEGVAKLLVDSGSGPEEFPVELFCLTGYSVRLSDAAETCDVNSSAPPPPAPSCGDLLDLQLTPVTADGALGVWARTVEGVALPGAEVALTGLWSQCPFTGGCAEDCLVNAPSLSTTWGVTDSEGVAHLLVDSGSGYPEEFPVDYFCQTGYLIGFPGDTEACNVNWDGSLPPPLTVYEDYETYP